MQVVELLLLYGANVNAQDSSGNTPLHACSLNGHAACAAMLLLHQADTALQTTRGDTALHLAAKWGDVDIVRLLLKAHVDSKIRNEQGQTALQATQSKAIRRLLEAYAAGIDLSLPSGTCEDALAARPLCLACEAKSCCAGTVVPRKGAHLFV